MRETEIEETLDNDRNPRERDALTREVNDLVEDRGVRFGGDEGHAFRVDPVPRVLERDEWAHLAGGIRQRVRALEAFLADVYGARRTVADGVVPERVIEGSGCFEPDLVGLSPAGGARISVAGLDVVREDDGGFHVLEDNVRTPSGIAYGMAASDAVAEVHGVDGTESDIEREMPAALRRCLEPNPDHKEGT